MELKFEWDTNKNDANLMKHGVSFKDAMYVFFDPKHLEIHDNKHSLAEDRWRLIGLNCCDLLTVVYTERNDQIRIISARKADKKETEEYYYGYCCI